MTRTDDRIVLRRFAVADMACRAEGSARVIDAYAAVFDTPTVIADWDGDYEEVISRGSFAKTISENTARVKAIFNHGRTIDGSPSERFSMPYGTFDELREDTRGLYTSVRVAATDLGDEVYELARSGAITGMSFQGTIVKSLFEQATIPGQIDRATITEIALKECGACVFPAYEAAGIVQVRARTVADQISRLSDQDRQVLVRMIDTTGTPPAAAPEGTADVEPPADTDTPPVEPSPLLTERARLRARQAQL